MRLKVFGFEGFVFGLAWMRRVDVSCLVHINRSGYFMGNSLASAADRSHFALP